MRHALPVAAALALGLLSSFGRAESAGAAARAEALLVDGTAAFEAGRLDAALRVHRRAWALSRSFRTAVGLGQVELHLGLFRDAAEHLAYALGHAPPGVDAELRRNVDLGLRDAMSHVVTVELAVRPEGSTVSIDGVVIGTTPRPGPLFVTPGTHEIVAEHAGAVATGTVTGVAGGTRAVRLDVVQPAPTPSEVVPASTTEARSASSLATSGRELPASTSLTPAAWVLVTGGSLTAGVLLASAAFGLAASAHDQDADEARARAAAAGGCGEAVAAAACTQIASATDGRDSDSQLATGLAVGAVALGVSTTVVAALLWPSASPPPGDVALVAGPAGPGAVLRGSF